MNMDVCEVQQQMSCVEPEVSTWAKIQKLPSDALCQVQSLYGEHLPIEVRYTLTHWFDSHPWEELDPDNPQHELYVSNIVPSLVAELQTRANSGDETNFLMTIKLRDAAIYFQNNYSHNPFLLVRVIKQCMQGEMRIIQQHENELRRMQQEREQIVIQNQESQKSTQLIIENQPPQVIIVNKDFTATIRLVMGDNFKAHMSPPQVKVSIINEAQASNLPVTVKMNSSSGEILYRTETIDYHQETHQWKLNFEKIKLHKIKRAGKKNAESVMDEKFCLLFQVQLKVDGEVLFHAWALSLPVVVIVKSSNQEPQAWATITWDNAFAEPGRSPFEVPDKVPWYRVGEVLSAKFKSDVRRDFNKNSLKVGRDLNKNSPHVGRDLNRYSLHVLAGKAFRDPSMIECNDMLLSWSQFCKEPLPNVRFTFWQWFYASLKVTQEHLGGLWVDGYVMGFVGKKDAEDLLLQKPTGTFLLRYSDSELGGVTIAWIADNPTTGCPEVYNLQPFKARDFGIRTLADRIKDLGHLTHLYPEVPKDEAFKNYYTIVKEAQPVSSKGYVRSFVQTVLQRLTGTSPDSSWATPPVHRRCSSTTDSVSDRDGHASEQSSSIDPLDSSLDQYDMDGYLPMADTDLPAVDLNTINNYDLIMSHDKWHLFLAVRVIKK